MVAGVLVNLQPEPELERPATFAPTVTEKANPSRNSGSQDAWFLFLRLRPASGRRVLQI